MQNISQSQFSDTKIALPPLPEQEAIVTYLDSKVAKIDEYISIAEKKIAALEELKQTIIAEAVTRGIHKDVPMRDSGVKWIGMIPEHWDLLRAKNIFERQFRPVRDCDEVVTCFRDGQVTLRKNRRIEGFTESLKEIGYQGIRKGDLVIHQMDAFAGSIGVSDSDGKGTPVYICCLPKDSKNVNVYFYA
ncbi:type I site-specific restriction-modification system, S subunit, partial [gut metagenome]